MNANANHGPGGTRDPGVTFELTISQNKHRAPSDSGMAAVLTVTAQPTNDGITGAQPGTTAVVILVDCSGSMAAEDKMVAARRATAAAIDTTRDGARFAIVEGTHSARMVYPRTPVMSVADATSRAEAKREVRHLAASGGTAMSSWLTLADRLLAAFPALSRHAILLTDGINESETAADLDRTLATCTGHFVCDARGIGETWDYHQLLRITSVLRGGAEAIRGADDLVADFRDVMGRAMDKSVPDLRIRIATAPGTRVRSLRQETPTLTDLTEHAVTLDERTSEFHTGSWTRSESREFLLDLGIAFNHLGERPPLDEDLRAARVDLITHGERHGKPAPILLRWTDDPVASTRIEPLVARLTGQEELSEALGAGCAALEAGDVQEAERQLARAFTLATGLGNQEILGRLTGLVDLTGDPSRPARLKQDWSRSALLRVAVSSVMFGSEAYEATVSPAPSAPETGATRECPCGRISRPSAAVCEACKRPFDPAAER